MSALGICSALGKALIPHLIAIWGKKYNTFRNICIDPGWLQL